VSAPRICVLGSITLDAIFRMPRFPGPGETLFADSMDVMPGGKGLNQAIAAARLGAEAVLIGRTGDDAFAEILLAAAREDGVDTRGVVRGRGRTGLAVPVVVPSGENAILAAPGANLLLTTAELEAQAWAIEDADALLLQFETPLDVVARAVAIAAAAGVRVILNPAPVRPFEVGLLELVDVLVVNEVESAMLAPGATDHVAEAQRLLAMGPGAVVITLGPAGGVFATAADGGEFAAFPVQAVDSVGAGDGFCGALAVALCEGLALAEAVRFAAAAAAISVTRPGAAPSLARRMEAEELLRTGGR